MLMRHSYADSRWVGWFEEQVIFNFMQACTRGDGIEGEDVTHNAQVIEGIPRALIQSGMSSRSGNRLNSMPSFLEVRGEVFMTHQSLQEVGQGSS
jgi:DNA ligase (NAD+)